MTEPLRSVLIMWVHGKEPIIEAPGLAYWELWAIMSQVLEMLETDPEKYGAPASASREWGEP